MCEIHKFMNHICLLLTKKRFINLFVKVNCSFVRCLQPEVPVMIHSLSTIESVLLSKAFIGQVSTGLECFVSTW